MNVSLEMPYDPEKGIHVNHPPVPTQVPRLVMMKDPIASMQKALTEGSTWALPKLLIRGCSIDMLLDEDGTTPLMFLLQKTEKLTVEQNDCIRYLISEGYVCHTDVCINYIYIYICHG